MIRVTGLSRRFGEVTAVDNLSFSVHAGEIFGFLGPNGAGKTTTLNILATLLEPDSGDVQVAGLDLRREKTKVKAMMGLVPQEIALFDSLTAWENVRFFAGLYGLRGSARKTAVTEALEFVGLADQAKKRCGRMSGGMKRRLNIACGIAHQPQIIILDEPTVGVDAQSREHIMGSIRVLRERGATIIYTSHYMPEVAQICDRIAIIDHGRMVAQGNEQELLRAVTDVKTIIVSTGELSGEDYGRAQAALTLLPDVRQVAWDARQQQLRIGVALGLSNLAPIIAQLSSLELPFSAIASELPDLETTFLALTGRDLRGL